MFFWMKKKWELLVVVFWEREKLKKKGGGERESVVTEFSRDQNFQNFNNQNIGKKAGSWRRKKEKNKSFKTDHPFYFVANFKRYSFRIQKKREFKNEKHEIHEKSQKMRPHAKVTRQFIS